MFKVSWTAIRLEEAFYPEFRPITLEATISNNLKTINKVYGYPAKSKNVLLKASKSVYNNKKCPYLRNKKALLTQQPKDRELSRLKMIKKYCSRHVSCLHSTERVKLIKNLPVKHKKESFFYFIQKPILGSNLLTFF